MRTKCVLFLSSLLVVAALLCGCQTTCDPSSLGGSFFSDMMYTRDSSSARVSSWDQSGKNIDMRPIPAGQELVLAQLEGAGCIRHIYFTIAGGQHYRRDLVLRMWWDGEATPSVEVPFGDMFGLGFERPRFYDSLMVTVNPGMNSYFGSIGYNLYFPMPFSDGARLTLTNEGEGNIPAVWYHVEYEKLDKIPKPVGRFHAQWRRENPTTPVGDAKNVSLHDGVNLDGKENYVILDAVGKGNLAGYFLNVDNLVGGWYGEGDDMIFIDGEKWPPSFHGTGSEEIFGGGACPRKEYSGPYTGFHLIANENFRGKNAMYRFFVADPIRFQKSIRVTIEHGHANNMANDYSSTAFWYQLEPHAPFPALLPCKERRPHFTNDAYDQACALAQKAGWAAQQIGMARMAGQLTVSPEEHEDVMAVILGQSRMIEEKKYDEAMKQSQRILEWAEQKAQEAGITLKNPF